jgi:hypothetical protein
MSNVSARDPASPSPASLTSRRSLVRTRYRPSSLCSAFLARLSPSAPRFVGGGHKTEDSCKPSGHALDMSESSQMIVPCQGSAPSMES